jgi:hypothetical protein
VSAQHAGRLPGAGSALPCVTQRSGPNVSLRGIGKLAIEFCGHRPIRIEAHLRFQGRKCGIPCWRYAIDGEAYAGLGLEERRRRPAAQPVVRPGGARAPDERHAAEALAAVEARAEFASGVGRVHGVVADGLGAAGEIGFAVARRAEGLHLHRRIGRDADRRHHAIPQPYAPAAPPRSLPTSMAGLSF